MPFKGISHLEPWQPFCSAERNDLTYFGRGYCEEQFCDIILNLGQLFRRCSLKDFLSGTLAAFCSVELNFYAILKEGIMGIIHVNLYEIWTIGSGGDVV